MDDSPYEGDRLAEEEEAHEACASEHSESVGFGERDSVSVGLVHGRG